jgi:hypothetical protein
LNNSDTTDNTDIQLLQNLRSVTHPERIYEYYRRAEKLVDTIIKKQGNTTATWDYYNATYVKDIINTLKAGNNEEAVTKILSMLDSIESALGE